MTGLGGSRAGRGAGAPSRDGRPGRSGAVGRWLSPATPPARIAWLRSILAVFALVDALLLSNNVVDRAASPALWDPATLPALLQLPPPTVPLAVGLLVALAFGAVLTITTHAHLLASLLVSGSYCLWMLYGVSFGYVAHDHMAIFVAMVFLPFAGRARYSDVAIEDPRRAESAGFAIRVVQIFTVATYTGSVVAKWVLSGSLVTWATSSTLTWAMLRRPSALNSEVLRLPTAMLWAGQTGALVMEAIAPLALWLRGRALLVLILVYVAFHATTLALLGIHFLPTVVCWLAFAPLERIGPWLSARRGRARPVR